MDSLDEKIQQAEIALETIRRERYEKDKDFHANREAMMRGVSLLRAKIETVLMKGIDFQVFHDAWKEVHENGEISSVYNLMHCGHEILLLSTIHQMEVHNNLLKVVGRQCKSMVRFLEQARITEDEEHAQLTTDLVREIASHNKQAFHKQLAERVDAQNHVIQKLRNLVRSLQEGSRRSLESVVSVSFRYLEEPLDDDSDMASLCSEQSPRDARYFKPSSLEKKLGSDKRFELQVDLDDVPL